MKRTTAYFLAAALTCACAPANEQQAPAQTAASPAQPAPSAVPAPPPADPAAQPAVAPVPANATAAAPETFKARFKTTKGDFVIEAHRSWAPRGADRFYNLVKIGYFKDVAFFRVIQGFMVQFGIHGDPALSAQWRPANIPDDPVTQSNGRGFITFAMAGPNTRTTQLFINFGNNANLDGMGFPPFGRVVSGMDVVDKIYNGYGEGAPRGRGPDQNRIQMQGNSYLKKDFPQMDYILSASLE